MGKKEVEVEIPYIPREWQSDVTKDFKQFTVLVVHRRAGKTVLDINVQIKHLLKLIEKRPGYHAIGTYVAPTFKQAKRIAWKFYKEYLRAFQKVETRPKKFEELVTFNESELRIEICAGITIYLLGAEDPDSLRGMGIDHCIIDEYQKMPDDLLEEVVFPCLQGNDGHLIITGTPKGKTDFYHKYKMGQNQHYKDWSSVLLTIYDTNVFNPKAIKQIQGNMSSDAFSQEYLCSWDANIKGSYFGTEVVKLRDQGRIVDKEYDPLYPVVAGLDLGLDGTCIWYMQIINEQPIIINIDYMEQKRIPYIANEMIRKGYVYCYIILGHDSVKTGVDVSIKNTSVGQFRKLGFTVQVAKYDTIDNAVHVARNLLDKCQITESCVDKKFKFGKNKSTALDSLALYRSEYDDVNGVQRKKEKHNRESHVGSALRNLAVGLRTGTYHDKFAIENMHSFKRRPKSNKTKNKWKKFRGNK